MEEDRPLSVRARKKVKAQIEKAERERLMVLFQRRMELAKVGAALYREGKFKEALQNYYSYLGVLERAKGAPRGALEPKHFDKNKDVAEILLLSGIFWDLVKLYDKSNAKDSVKLKLYLSRFVLFSKGFPFQHISAERIRKYLSNGLPRNRKEFKDAHIQLGGGKCFIATAVEDYCEPDTLPALRAFRDKHLLTRSSGRIFVKVYYCVGPVLARLVLESPVFTQMLLAKSLDRFKNKLNQSNSVR